jgi:hypothetical protein
MEIQRAGGNSVRLREAGATTRTLLVVIVAALAGGTWAIVWVRNQRPVPFAKSCARRTTRFY